MALVDPRHALQQAGDASQQFRVVEGFRNVVVGAAGQAADAIGVLGLGRKHDDRQVGVPRFVDAIATAHAAAQVDAAHTWQHHVQQHQVGLRLREQFDRLFGGAGGQHRVVVCAEVLNQKLHDSGLVLDDEHG
jgi:hypothetical protein